MQDSSTALAPVLQFRHDVQDRLRTKIREVIEAVLDEELLAALGSDRHERTVGRRGYRHGARERIVTTAEGTSTLGVPRGRIQAATGTTEFHSAVLPRYARRTRDVDDAVLGCYLAGANSRRIRAALKPLLGRQHLSKSAVSRVVARLKALFELVVVPVLAALGVTESGQKQLIALQLAASRDGSGAHAVEA